MSKWAGGAGRVLALAVIAAALAAGSLVLVRSYPADASSNLVRIHLGSDARQIAFGGSVQALTTGKNSCVLTSAEPLIDLSSEGSRSAPGIADDGIGVKDSPSSGNGTPCAQVDRLEALIMRPGPSLAGRAFAELQFDLEMTGDAIVALTLTGSGQAHTYRLQTGNSIHAAQASEADYDRTMPYEVSSTDADDVDACAAPNSSGPNSAANDNCRWTVTPGFAFDTIRLTTEIGTVSLEGSGDFGNDPDHDSVLLLANAAPTSADDTVVTEEATPVTFDVLANDTDPDSDRLSVSAWTQPASGTLSGSSVGSFTYTPGPDFFGSDSFQYTITDGRGGSSTATVAITVLECASGAVTDSDGAIDATFTRLGDPIACKRYSVEADAATGSVLFRPEGSGQSAYRGYLSFGPKDSPIATSPALDLLLEYDPTGGFNFRPVLWCIEPAFDQAGNVIGATLPTGETWCVASESTRGVAGDNVLTVWQVFGDEDPRFQ